MRIVLLSSVVLVCLVGVGLALSPSATQESVVGSFSSPAACDEFRACGDMTAIPSKADAVRSLLSDTPVMPMARSTGCTTGCTNGCTGGCTYGCTGGCTYGCTYGCSYGCK